MHLVIELQVASEGLEFGSLWPVTDNAVFNVDIAF